MLILNGKILSMMGNSTKSAQRQNEFKLSSSLFSHLEKNYGLTNSFTNGESFLKEEGLFEKRFFNKTDFSAIFQDKLKQSTFVFRSKTPRNTEYIVNENMERFKPPKEDKILVMKFTVDLKKV